MNQEQISRLLDVLEKIATRSQTYTIAGAADWPILIAMVAVLGMLISIVVAMIGFMWRDMRLALNIQKADFEKDIDTLWNGMRDCRDDCCPRREKIQK